ncbi:sulphite reductase hemo protein, beta subunit [Leucogyrophana mollusca]|uniref:Sulphite reductase hemo protein, beta subunit n=1 Tax=Leucogyrophana mollusca TaxID=85980 RepID=A0ACB8BKM0_9AGAM|nr:sulphite reductase hemo protein, beta subunit [Leucogyrophana mollusca]
MSTAISSVARIAFLASDIIVDSQPTPPATSAFAEKYNALLATSSRRPTVLSVPLAGDPGSSLLRNASGTGLVSFTAASSSQTVIRLVLHAAELSSLALVLHLAVTDDLSDVLLLRSAVPFFLISHTPQEAHDNAVLASRLARTEKKAVVHVFVQGEIGEVREIAEDDVQPLLLAEKLSSVKANGSTNGHSANGANGHTNGVNGTSPSPHSPANDLFTAYESAALSTLSCTHRPCLPLAKTGASEPHTVIFTLGKVPDVEMEGVSFVSVGLLTPLPPSRLLDAAPPSATRVIILEQLHHWNTKWTPLYLDVIDAIHQRQSDPRPHVQSVYFTHPDQITAPSVLKLIQTASSAPSTTPINLGSVSPSPALDAPHVPKHESSYTKILSHLFDERLEISNSPSLVPAQGAVATSPEYALGRVRGQLDQRAELIRSIQELMELKEVDEELHKLLSQWLLVKDDAAKSRALSKQVITALEASKLSNRLVDRILALRAHFPARSRWIIGSDAWSYDLGSSGLHHTIASGLDINILVLDTLPYTSRNSADPHRRKQDVGLYAMNHGDVYVASIAVYSSYAQVLQAFVEADRHKGPSIVLAYLPYQSEESTALEVLKETKLAVDAGYWPLYRWDPVKEQEGKEPFTLDSDAVKNDLQQFLDRQNHLSQLVRSKPQFATELVSSLGENVKEARRRKAQQAYDELLVALDAPPLLVLYASDGGTGEKYAKKLANRGKARGLSATIGTLDSRSIDDLAQEEYVVFVTSVAGQGEPPQNGRTLFKALNAAANRGEKPFSKLRFSVFGLGDSHYWPRPEDAHYYNKPCKDLDARLEQLGGQRFADLGLGDDQDADGPETGYKVWEPLIWKTFGVDSVEVQEAEPDPITNEHIKAASGFLRGTIAEGLEDTSTGALAASDTQLTKFHGIYQQDDRDIRDERQAQGVEPAYSFMIRVRMPGGVCTPDQWLQMDQIADEHGCGTFKITTRATFQFHGVIKRHLKPSIQAINKALLDTLAACGDVNRNVICSAIPTLSKLHKQVYDFAKLTSAHLLPRTTAYHEIWLDKKMVAGEAVKDFEPLYGEFYLPRKFKIAVAVPPTNDVDIFANDLGFIAIVDDHGDLAGFNVTVGGGMGVTHGNKKTYPRLADVIGFCTVEQGPIVAEKVMLTQRDNGNRQERKNARLKYTIDRMGLDVFKAEVESRLGYKLAPARPYTFDRNVDDYGWATGENGEHHVMLYIENGRIQDEPGRDFKTGLREIAKVHKGTFRLTANQHLMLSDIAAEDVPEIKRLLAKYKLDNLSHSALRLSSSACVSFPTCGLAMAESERYLPVLVDKVEKMCEENGLRNDSIVMRMTGCPNGCARPYVAEVAFVGKAPGSYAMLLGGGYYGQRLNKIYREAVSEPEILAILGPMIKRYALERLEGERFGDFVIRAGYIAPTTSGKEWYDRMGGEGEYREVAAA